MRRGRNPAGFLESCRGRGRGEPVGSGGLRPRPIWERFRRCRRSLPSHRTALQHTAIFTPVIARPGGRPAINPFVQLPRASHPAGIDSAVVAPDGVASPPLLVSEVAAKWEQQEKPFPY